jgi:uncharacterized protein (TIGR00369 family)
MNIQNSKFFKKIFVQYVVPMNRTMGIKLKSISDSETVLGMKRKRKNLNYGGTVHGAAIMALAETVHGVSVLSKIGAFNNIMVSKKTDLTFLKKAKGYLEVRFRLGEDKGNRIEQRLQEKGRCEVDLKSEVIDQAGDHVAVLNATYHIKRLQKK